jgi:hypothetical protein
MQKDFTHKIVHSDSAAAALYALSSGIASDVDAAGHDATFQWLNRIALSFKLVLGEVHQGVFKIT